MMRLRPGHQKQFADRIAVYKTVAGRVAPNLTCRIDAVFAGERLRL